MTTRQSLPVGAPSGLPRGFCTMAVTRVFSSDSLTRAASCPGSDGPPGGPIVVTFEAIARPFGGQAALGHETPEPSGNFRRKRDLVLDDGERGRARRGCVKRTFGRGNPQVDR